MLLIQKGKATRRACDRCHRVNREIRGRSSWCEQCREDALAMILADYQIQITEGIPAAERSVMIPLDFTVFDDRFVGKLRAAIEELDRPARRLVAV